MQTKIKNDLTIEEVSENVGFWELDLEDSTIHFDKHSDLMLGDSEYIISKEIIKLYNSNQNTGKIIKIQKQNKYIYITIFSCPNYDKKAFGSCVAINNKDYSEYIKQESNNKQLENNILINNFFNFRKLFNSSIKFDPTGLSRKKWTKFDKLGMATYCRLQNSDFNNHLYLELTFTNASSDYFYMDHDNTITNLSKNKIDVLINGRSQELSFGESISIKAGDSQKIKCRYKAHLQFILFDYFIAASEKYKL